ncbi:conjugal transfer protein [Culicoidibacter larvae]|uniref:Uncharacterized protein n=1 Tax=Culicoidibacter larvae TaxID=2579976 RepID=A0A5R8QI23_9FIRM|nr:conjugal transfer protein [Culicoidibacter larvae]TLG77340.1 hypothetical protein FEZ08_01605 [Culicoidibacter larvae]
MKLKRQKEVPLTESKPKKSGFNFKKLGRRIALTLVLIALLFSVYGNLRINSAISSMQEAGEAQVTTIDAGSEVVGRNVLLSMMNVDPNNSDMVKTRQKFLTGVIAPSYLEAYLPLPKSVQQVTEISAIKTDIFADTVYRVTYNVSYDVNEEHFSTYMALLIQAENFNYKVVSDPQVIGQGEMGTLYEQTFTDTINSDLKETVKKHLTVFFEAYFGHDTSALDVLSTGIKPAYGNYTFRSLGSIQVDEKAEKIKVIVYAEEQSSGQQLRMTYILEYKTQESGILITKID